MSHEGLEPSTLWLKVKCSTNWANGSWLGYLDSNQGNDGVKVRCLTAWLYPNNRMVGRSGFEPLNPKERIYSPPRLASSLSSQNIKKMPARGLEPPTYWLQVSCSTYWAKSACCKQVRRIIWKILCLTSFFYEKCVFFNYSSNLQAKSHILALKLITFNKKRWSQLIYRVYFVQFFHSRYKARGNYRTTNTLSEL